MAKRKLHIVVIDSIKFGKEATVGRIIKTKLIPALRKQLPNFKWKIYRPVVGGKLGLMILIAPVSAEHLANYDEWIVGALEREHGKKEAARYLKVWYDCLDSSEYMAVVEEPEWSNP